MQSYAKVNEHVHRGSTKAGKFITFSARAARGRTLGSLGFLAAVLTLLVVSVLAQASELKGMVINGSSRKPSVGDEVVLLTLSHEGMSESASAKTDRAGRFRLSVLDARESHLVRVTHQGVTYHKMVEPDLRPVTIQIYDAAENLDGISAIMDVQRFEANNGKLEVKQLITVRNASKPPRTLMNDRTFEFQLPPEAQVQSGLVQIEDGQPLKQKPVPGEQKGHYYFSSPLRPGDTRFAVVYRLPYTGEVVIDPKLRNPSERFVIMLPRSMRFEPKVAGTFLSMPNVSPDNVQGTTAVRAGQVLAFRISGTGTLEELQGSRQAQARETPREQPGGGLGAPIDAPDPLHGERWQIFVGLIVMLGIGAVWAMRRPGMPRTSERLSRLPCPELAKSWGCQKAVQASGRRKHRQRVSHERLPLGTYKTSG